MITIKNYDDARVSGFKSLKQKSYETAGKKLFIAESELVVLELLKSDLIVHKLFCLKKYIDKYKELIQLKGISKDSVFTADKIIMNKIVGFRLHQGILAMAEIPEPTNIEYLEGPVVLLNGIINSENTGAIVRNCAAFGVNSIVFDKETSHIYLRRSVRVSMGSVFQLSYTNIENLVPAILKLKSRGFSIISIENDINAVNINNFDFPGKYALCFGSEKKGIAQEILEISDKILYIPIKETVPSVNVAAASAVVLNAARKS